MDKILWVVEKRESGAYYMEKTDKRYVQTHSRIYRTFEELILTYPYGEVTVSMLVREVGINRKTFYLHYASLDALLDELVDRIAAEIVGYMEVQQTLFTEEAIEGYVQMLARNLPLHKRLICAPEYLFVFQRVSETVVKRRFERMRGDYALDGFRLRAATAAISMVTMQTYRSWLMEEMPISAGELAAFVNQMLSGNMITMLR